MKKAEYNKYIKKNVSIVDACRAFNIPLQKRGEVYVCRCPKHTDEHPSLTIYDKENSYHCFQCGDSGDVFRFVMGQKEWDFHTALNWIEQNFPNVKEKMADLEEDEPGSGKKNGYEIAWQIYQQMSDEEKDKLHEFAKRRNFTDRQFQAAEVVLVLAGKLSQYFPNPEDYIEQLFLLEEKGLLRKVPKERHATRERYQDYFRRERVLIPLRDADGSILGFAGRAVRDDIKPKYLFSKGLKKGSFLYRLYNVIHSRSKKKPVSLCLVEGIFDAIRLEAKGQYAVAVLGSHLTQNQAQVLENSVREGRCQLSSICIFMDSDEAGLQGNYRTIKNILKNSVLRTIPLTVRVLKDRYKDPDEYYSRHGLGNTESVREYSVNEYLFRYFLKKDDLPLTELDIESEFFKRTSEEKISILNQIQNMLPYGDWKEYLEYLDVLGVEPDSEEAVLHNRIKNYILTPGKTGSETYSDPVEFFFHMQNAIQVARTSYEREDITLDDWTWDRIAASADVFYPFLYETLKGGKQFQQPLVRLMVPKKRDEQRPKSMYMHEQLILQQYILNELLSSGTSVKYENYIPAVRYSSERHSYTTGYHYSQCFEQPVSFAYQIDMDVMNGVRPATEGMFRNFYDCWKDYIYYIQDGVNRLEGDVVYRVKLDISGYYDHISRPVAREALFDQLKEALRADESKFQCFVKDGEDGSDRSEIAGRTMEWLLDQLFESRYYQPFDGTLAYKDFENIGIPQGPNLSAYMANIVLFPLDRIIREYVHTINETVEDPEKIKIRYARYVDDMVIVSSDSFSLLKLKNMIQSWLFEAGFELSPKTDQADGISKEDAIEWTKAERGGLGVSVGFDFPDDSMDSVLDECVEVEHTDRRTLLKLLRRVLSDVLYEGIPSDKQNFSELLKTVFQTEEIRLNDMVRFSEIMIRKAAEESEKDLLDAFYDIWEEGMEECPPDSLLWAEGLPCYVFLMGCERILKRLRKMSNGDGYVLWEQTRDKLAAFFRQRNIVTEFEALFQKAELLKVNQNMLLVQIMKIEALIARNLPESEGKTAGSAVSDNRDTDRKIRGESEYEVRWKWQWQNALGNSKMIQQPAGSGASHIRWFHWMLIRMRTVEDYIGLKEIFNRVKTYLEAPITEDTGDILYSCMFIWSAQNSGKYDENTIKATLFTLLNILPGTLRAEAVSKISEYKHILFQEEQHMLPVMPGVESPGIMALEKKDAAVTGAIRYDFISDGEELVPDRSTWEEIPWNEEAESAKQNIFGFRRGLGESDHYISLQSYVEARELNSAGDVLGAIAELYPGLSKAIRRQMECYPGKRQIFCGENVLLSLEPSGKYIEKTELGVTYLMDPKLLPESIAISQSNGSYILKQVNRQGAPFWITGRLLENVCDFEKYLLVRTEDKNQSDQQDLEMLRYASYRITGQYRGKYALRHRSMLSYQKSVERVVENIQRYLETSENRLLCLENAKIENEFISYRMSLNVSIPEDWSMAVWAKRYLSRHYKRLVEIAEDFCMKPQPEAFLQNSHLNRRVCSWYEQLGARLYQIYEGKPHLKGVGVLSKALWADAVLMNLRMQVLELIQYLSEGQREWLKTQYTELPLESLGLDETAVLTMNNKKWDVIWRGLLDNQRVKDLKYLTHLGWIGILGILLEIDQEQGVVFGREKEVHGQMVDTLQELTILLSRISSEDNQEFPYENLKTFLELWIPEKMQQMIDCMNRLDQLLKIHVDRVETAFFTLKVAKNEVAVQVDGEEYRKPLYFVTYSKKKNDGLDGFEKKLGQKEQFLFTCSRKSNQLLGVSMIADSFGQTLQMWEEKLFPGEHELQSPESVSKEYAPQTEAMEAETEPEKSRQGEANGSESSTRESQKETAQKTGGDGCNHCKMDSNLKNRIHSLHKNWKKRQKPFVELDRIALFQFEIDSSYLPPDKETLGKDEIQKDWGATSDLETYALDKYRPSFAEYRRRQLLEPVLEACNDFGVEILLLPEYSVRPETVEWMCRQLKEKEYKFSIWAGTFKIPVGYSFESNYWKIQDKETLSQLDYWNSAPLPVIWNDSQKGENGEISIITCKFKKYPAVALKEEINPVPAIWDMKEKNSFLPIREKIPDIASDVRDARKDVTELICAETFAVSNIVNYPSFLKMSMEAYQKYAGKTDLSFKEYKGSMIRDIINFGKSAAMFQINEDEGKRKHRSSIILIPACSTRAADYYVIGQGNYLAAGVKTVFCNCVDEAARGGSCFIGQNSWDDVKRRRGDDQEKNEVQEILSENTYYHGLNPGIYQQTSHYSDRGALGKREQALLICDVAVNEKTNPTTESAISSLSVVAHIPILEIKRTKEEMKKGSEFSECKRCAYEKTVKSIEELVDLYGDNQKEERINTMFDNQAERGQQCLRTLGEIHHSDWLIQRGEYYHKYHKIKPQAWPAPTLIDWMYVETDYEAFVKEVKEGIKEKRNMENLYFIQVTDW